MMLLVLPLSFASSTFVQASTMPGWLQAFVKVNPISHARRRGPRPAARRPGRPPRSAGRSPGSPGCWWCSSRWPCAATSAAPERPPRLGVSPAVAESAGQRRRRAQRPAPAHWPRTSSSPSAARSRGGSCAPPPRSGRRPRAPRRRRRAVRPPARVAGRERELGRDPRRRRAAACRPPRPRLAYAAVARSRAPRQVSLGDGDQGARGRPPIVQVLRRPRVRADSRTARPLGACSSLARADVARSTSNRAQRPSDDRLVEAPAVGLPSGHRGLELSRARARSPRRAAISASCSRSWNSSSRDPSSFSAASASV